MFVTNRQEDIEAEDDGDSNTCPYSQMIPEPFSPWPDAATMPATPTAAPLTPATPTTPASSAPGSCNYPPIICPNTHISNVFLVFFCYSFLSMYLRLYFTDYSVKLSNLKLIEPRVKNLTLYEVNSVSNIKEIFQRGRREVNRCAKAWTRAWHRPRRTAQPNTA